MKSKATKAFQIVLPIPKQDLIGALQLAGCTLFLIAASLYFVPTWDTTPKREEKEGRS